MKFTPKTDKEIAEANLILEGFYNFEVTKAEEKMSQGGSPMIELEMRIKDMNGKDRMVRDWLLESMPAKLKSFCDVSGLDEQYEAGELDAVDCKGKYGRLHLIQKDTKDGKRNNVKEYFKLDETKIEELPNF